MCFNWITDVSIPLATTVAGGVLTLIGVKMTLNNEKKSIAQKHREKMKPILINYTCTCMNEERALPKFVFKSDGEATIKTIKGIFKNADGGVVFIDKIVTEKTTYYPEANSTIDKNTAFVVELHNLSKETLKTCKIFCHDILGYKYYYDAEFVFDINVKSEIKIGNIHALPIREMNNSDIR